MNEAGSVRPQRKTPVHHLPVIRGNRAVVIFLTICTQQRKCLLGRREAHALILEAWRHHTAWRVGRYVLMPDHLHLFSTPGPEPTPPLAVWIAWWKRWVSVRWPNRTELPIWQRSFWDTQLRAGESYDQKWDYVRANPVRAGLCAVSEAWPFQGEATSIDWHD